MKSRKPSIPYIIWMVVFTMIPIIMIGFTAFTDKNGNFSLQAFTNAFYYTNIFVKSLWIALISTAICLVLAYPLAHYVAYDSYVDELSAKNLRMGNAFAGQRSD